MKKILESHNIK